MFAVRNTNDRFRLALFMSKRAISADPFYNMKPTNYLSFRMNQGNGENNILGVVLTDESAMVVLFACCYRLRDLVGSLFHHNNCYYLSLVVLARLS